MGKFMLKLAGPVLAKNNTLTRPTLVRLTTNAKHPEPLRKNTALLVKNFDHVKEEILSLQQSRPFAAILIIANPIPDLAELIIRNRSNIYFLNHEFAYLENGDIVRLDPIQPRISVAYRGRAPSNSILLTERCNHLCLMCSQPPKNVDDSWLLEEALELIRMIPPETQNIGITGGEPTIYGDGFIRLISTAKHNLPSTTVDVLTNGRAFHDESYARELAEVKHPALRLGIPLYSDDPVRHNYVVQSTGAFDETLRGILNLKRHGLCVEIRVVIHKETVSRLLQTCQFIARNLLFVDHVALMGLEITGFTRANLDKLWIDPYEYRDVLSDAIAILKAYGIHCSVYNHQLCILNRDIDDVYRKSISDWKNEYLPQCGSCARKSDCGGFFSSQIKYRYSAHISPF